MSAKAQQETIRVQAKGPNYPSYVHHPDFDQPKAAERYLPSVTPNEEYETRHMPDEATRDHARRMHYAAYRMHKSRTAKEASLWQQRYFRLRDEIVLGNRKLIYRAVRRRMAMANRADDLIGDCHIVLIQAVAAFNPWLGIRFSTYAYTCLVRALSRLSQRLSTDWLARSIPLESLPDGEPHQGSELESSGSGLARLDEFLRDDHPLLSQREKMIISRRFSLQEDADLQTLEKVGKDLGLSKERVRQVQASALGKLRRALLGKSDHS